MGIMSHEIEREPFVTVFYTSVCEPRDKALCKA